MNFDQPRHLRIGAEDDQAEKMRTMIIAIQNFDAIHSPTMRDIKIQTAQAGKNN